MTCCCIGIWGLLMFNSRDKSQHDRLDRPEWLTVLSGQHVHREECRGLCQAVNTELKYYIHNTYYIHNAHLQHSVTFMLYEKKDKEGKLDCTDSFLKCTTSVQLVFKALGASKIDSKTKRTFILSTSFTTH